MRNPIDTILAGLKNNPGGETAGGVPGDGAAAPAKKQGKQVRKRFVALLILILLFVSAFYLNGANNKVVHLTRYDVYDNALPGVFYGYQILVVSDFHNAYFFDQIDEIIKTQRPNAVLFAGGMTRLPYGKTENLEALVSGLPKDIPAYAVSGFQETADSVVRDRVRAIMENAGIDVIDDESVMLTAEDGSSVRLVGIADPGVPDDDIDGSPQLENIRSFIQKATAEKMYTILLCNRTTLYPELRDLKANLMLSGYLRGGIIRLPPLGGMINADGTLFPRYSAGVYKDTDMTLAVSRGCDYEPGSMRFFNGPEVIIVTLRR
jgi:predicted MPP superfamily phosphohydrolase